MEEMVERYTDFNIEIENRKILLKTKKIWHKMQFWTSLKKSCIRPLMIKSVQGSIIFIHPVLKKKTIYL